MEEGDENELVLVTGGTGFLASWIIKELLDNDFTVRTTVRNLEKEYTYPHLKEFKEEYGEDRLEIVQADLEDSAEKWYSIVKDCTYILHVASPFPIAQPADEQDLIRPALAGTLTVLNAAVQEKSIRRIVLTSAFLSTCSGHKDENTGKHVWTETDWGNKHKSRPFSKSKILAEKAAWDFVQHLPKERNLELVTILPSFIFGPILSPYGGSSSRKVITRFLKNEMPGVPEMHINIVDVRDCAKAHVEAMLQPEAAGHRFLCSAGGLWLRDIGALLDKKYTPKGYKIPTNTISKALLWFVKWWDDDIATIFPMLGKEQIINTEKIKSFLNVQFRPVDETILDMAKSLIEFDVI
jgi:nucleoside-diphosphate-sugar epimerase